jgi:integrase
MIERHILPALGDLPMAEITTSTMTDFFDSLYGELKEGSISNIYSLLALMFDIALEYKLIGSKPIAKRLHKPEYERAEKPILSVEDARRILKGLSHSHRLFVAVLAVLPVRANEGAALRWMNVDFERGILSVTHGLWSGKLKTKLKTKATRRRFEIPNGLLSALKQWRALSKFDRDEDFIFCNSVGRPLDPGHFRTYVLYPLMDSLEIKRGSHTHGLHILRHTAATVLHEITGDIEVAQRALGHARRSTTEGIYDHAEKTVDVKTTGLLLEWLLGSESDLLQQTETVN